MILKKLLHRTARYLWDSIREDYPSWGLIGGFLFLEVIVLHNPVFDIRLSTGVFSLSVGFITLTVSTVSKNALIVKYGYKLGLPLSIAGLVLVVWTYIAWRLP